MKKEKIIIAIIIALALLYAFISNVGIATKGDIKNLDNRIEKVEIKVDRNFDELIVLELNQDTIKRNNRDIKKNTDTIKAAVRIIGRGGYNE